MGLLVAASPFVVVADNPSDGLQITPIVAYNFIVDSNVLSPSTYAPRAASIGAEFCNVGGSTLTNVTAYTGNFANDTPGIYPTRVHTENPGLTGFTNPYTSETNVFYLTHEGGSAGLDDATRYLGTLDPGECRTQYWLVSYPNVDAQGDDSVTGGIQPNDDLYVFYDFWATADGVSPAASVTRRATMRNEISASANKIWPNGDNKVPDEYLQAIQATLGWDTINPDGTGTSAYPGQVLTTQGIWYDLGNVGEGFDNDGDGVADHNAWLQPIGDANSYDPGCFRLVKTYGIVVVKLQGGGEYLIPFEDQLYFENVPDNTGAVGLVFYQYAALDGVCTAGLTPYQEVASGRDNEKFSGDYGIGIPPLTSLNPNVTLGKTDGITSITPPGNTTYTLTVNNTGANAVDLGNPDLGVPLVVRDSLPTGTTLQGTPTSSLPSSQYTVRYSNDDGATWTNSPVGTVTDVEWWLTVPFPANTTATFSVTVNVPSTYEQPLVTNEAALRFGTGRLFNEVTDADTVSGDNAISGTAWQDTGSGNLYGDGLLDGTETGRIVGATVTLYVVTGNGEVQVATDVTDANGFYEFLNLPDGDYRVEITPNTASYPGYINTTDTSIDVPDLTSPSSGHNFGFAPALVVTKTLATATPTTEGSTVTFTINVENQMPGTGSQFCEYIVWARTEGSQTSGSSSGVWTNRTNAFGAGGPDNLFATALFSTNDDLISGQNFWMAQQAGNITKVEALFNYYLNSTVTDTTPPSPAEDDQLDVFLFFDNTQLASDIFDFSEMNALSPAVTDKGNLAWDVTSARTWSWDDFNQSLAQDVELQVTANRISGSDDINGNLDAMGFRITTDQNCGASDTTTLNPVPLVDTYDASRLQFVSASVTPSNVSSGVITWDNVGPIYAGGTVSITVNFRALDPGASSVTTINTASVTDARYADGSDANDDTDNTPNTDDTDNDASVTIQQRGSIAGFIYRDANNSGWNYQAGTDIGISGVTVTLLACQISGSNFIPANLTTRCTGGGRAWASVQTTTTASDGSYTFEGLLKGYYLVQVTTASGPLVGMTQRSEPNDQQTTDDVNKVAALQVASGATCGTCNNQWGTSDTSIAITTNQLNSTNFNPIGLTAAQADSTLEDIAGVNFGYNAAAPQVYGKIWEDSDGDATIDSAEDYLSGVTVVLRNLTTNATTSTTTNSNGEYLFTGLTAGTNYRIEVTQPNGTVQTFDPGEVGVCVMCDNQHTTGALAANIVSGPHNFGYQPTGTASIGNLVYYDYNGDGDDEGGMDAGIAGVTIWLYEDENSDGILQSLTEPLVRTAVTDSTGNYLFANLLAGDYLVVVNETTVDASLSQTGDPDETGTCNACDARGIVADLGASETRVTLDFGYAASGTGSIGDTVFRDRDGNGTQSGATETGISGITVELWYNVPDSSGSLVMIASAVTNSDGNYLFENLPNGSYEVRLPTLETNNPNLPEDPFGNSWVNTTGTLTGTIENGTIAFNATVTGGGADLDNDFGFAQLGAVGDTIYWDANENGDQDWNEVGISGVTVSLYRDLDNDGDYLEHPVYATDVTDADGKYFFSALPPDANNAFDYLVVVGAIPGNPTLTADPNANGVPCTDPDAEGCDGRLAVSIYYGTTFTGADFGYLPPRAIGDYIWYDQDNDGVQDATEAGISGVTVELYTDVDNNNVIDGLDALVDTVESDPDGGYWFTNPDAGSYIVRIAASNFNVGGALQGYTNSFDPDGGLNGYAGADVGAADVVDTIDFGYTIIPTNPLTLSGNICLEAAPVDAACDDGTDTQLSGRTVYLTLNNVLVAQTITDSNGFYQFTNLADGTYKVSIQTVTSPLDAADPTNPVLVVPNGDGTTAARTVVMNNTSQVDIDLAFETVVDYDFGDLPSAYSSNTLLANDGARHTIPQGGSTLYLGSAPDADPDGDMSTVDATADANDDGVTFINPSTWSADATADNNDGSVQVTTTGGGWLVGFIDFNDDGDFADSGEMIISQNIGGGTTTIGFDLPVGTFSTSVDYLYARFRLFEEAPIIPGISYKGAAENGEVEDYRFPVNTGTPEYDYGDLPASYGTARHIVPTTPTLFLGTAPDTDASAYYTALANGDDLSETPNDEDGITPVNLSAWDVGTDGGSVNVDVTGSGWLLAWFDFSGDGDFGDTGEFAIDQAVTGDTPISFDIPASFDGPGSELYARYRLFPSRPSSASFAYSGLATSGEVEDYIYNPSFVALTIDKDTTTPTVYAGEEVTYTISVQNEGNEEATNVTISDVLPTGFSYVDGSLNVTMSFATRDTTSNPAGGATTLAFGTWTIESGGSVVLEFDVLVDENIDLSGGSTFDNTASVDSNETDPVDDDGEEDNDADTIEDTDPEDDEDVTVIDPDMTLTKTAVPTFVYLSDGSPESDVLYTIELENTGNDPLANVIVSDNTCSPLSSPTESGTANGILDVGETWTYTCTEPDVSADTTNTATATADDSAGNELERTAQANVDVIDPDMSLTKTAEPGVVYADDGSPDSDVLYTIELENTGDDPLVNVSVSDDRCSPLSSPTESATANNILDVGETWTYTCTEPDVSTDTTNTATATADDSAGNEIERTAQADVDVINPDMTLTKTAVPSVVYADDGSPDSDVLYTIELVNTGDDPLVNVAVSDNTCSPLSSPSEGGTVNTILDVGETWTYTCTEPDVSIDTTNTATATADDSAGNELERTAQADVDVIDPDMTLTKTAQPGVVYADDTSPDSDVLFTIELENTGDDPLVNVNVSDDTCTPLSSPTESGTANTILDVGETWTYTCTEPDVSIDTTNTATATADDSAGNELERTAQADVDVIDPSVLLTKSTTTPTVVSGDDVTFVITVENTGDVPLDNVVVSDDTCSTPSYVTGDITNTGVLDTDETWTYSCTLSAVTADFTNTADVTADDPLDNDVTDEDTETVDVIAPSVLLTKSTSTPIVVSGDDVTFSITVENTGDVALDNVQVTDDTCSTPSYVSGDATNTGVLDIDETWTYTCTVSGVTNDFTNTADVTADDPLDNPVTEEDTESVDVIAPSVLLTKSTTTPTVVSGEDVTFTITVENTGDVSLDNVLVSDDTCSTPTYVSGDTANIGILDTDESWTYSCTVNDVTNDFTNTADVTADDPLDNPVTDEDEETVDIIHPSLELTKSTLTPTVVSGDDVTFSITVDNTGDVPLDNVAVSDNTCSSPSYVSGDSANTGVLDLDETWTYSCTVNDVTADFTNTADVTADDPLDNEVTDDGAESVNVIAPSVLLTKSTNTPIVVSGSDVTFTMTVENDGDVPLDNVVVTDDTCSTPAYVSGDTANTGVLDLDETWTYTCIVSGVTIDFTNTADVTADDPLDNPVTDEDTESVDVVAPDITLSKSTTTPTVVSGDDVTFTITVENTGDVLLDTVVVSDDTCSTPTYVSGDTANPDVLDIDETWTYSCTVSNVTTDFTNTAGVTADDPLDNEVTDEDTESVDVINPSLELSKSTATQTVVSGDDVTFSITVENTGDVALDTVVVSDDTCSTPTYVSGDTANTDVLDINETWTYSCTVNDVTADFTNTADVTADDPLDNEVTDGDTESVDVIAPSVLLTKSTTTTTVLSGSDVTFTITVANDGNVPLDNIVVSDDTCSTPSYVSGDTANTGVLDLDETWTYTCTVSGVTTDFTNTADVTADDPLDNPVTDDDTEMVDVINPSVLITKSTATPTVVSGDDVAFSITVENTGDVPLDNVVVSDDTCSTPAYVSGDTANAGVLDIDETWMYSCTVSSVTADFTNTAEVTADDPLDNNVTDEGTETVDVITPSVLLTKSTTTPIVVSGSDVTFSITVENTGDVPLSNVEVTDDTCSTPSYVGGDTTNTDVLDTDETWTYSCTVNNVTTDFTNTADVTANDPFDNEVTDEDTETVAVIAPEMALTKAASPETVYADDTSPDSDVLYTIELENVGDDPLINVSVIDDTCSPLSSPEESSTVNGFLDVGETWTYTCTELDVSVDTTNTATATADDSAGNELERTAQADVNVIDPSVLLTKSTITPTVVSGDDVTFTITVENTGDVALDNVVVSDDTCSTPSYVSGDDANTGVLDTDETWTYSCTVSTVTADFTNTASVTAGDPLDNEVTDEDTETVDVITPSVLLTKSTTTPTVVSGDNVTFSITVENTGDVALDNVVVSDDTCSTPSYVSGDTANTGVLDLEETWTYTCNVSGVTADFTNTADVTADDPLDNEVTDDDTEMVDVINPSVLLTKSTTTPTVVSGDDVTFSITVENTGDVPLDNVQVSDDTCSTPSYVSGDTTNVGILDTDETWTYNCTVSNVIADFTNTADVTADDPLDNEVTDEDTEDVDVIDPDMTLTKTAAPDTVYADDASPGSDVVYTIALENTGDDALVNINVTDDTCTPLSAASESGTLNGILDIGETWTYTCTALDVSVDMTNTATATADDSAGNELERSATADVDVIDPSVLLTKSTTTPTAVSGEDVTFSITVENTGDSPLDNVQVTDDTCSTPSYVSGDTANTGILDIDETWTYSCAVSNVTTNFANTAEVTADDPLDNEVTDDDTEDVTVVTPGINIEKTPETQDVVEGGTSTFALSVTLDGDVPLQDVVVTDAQCDDVSDTLTRTGGDDGDDILEALETWTYSCTISNVTADFTNNADVAAQYDTSDTDSADVNVLFPSLSVTKTANASSVLVGGDATFTISVDNDGDTPLSNVQVSDAQCDEADINGFLSNPTGDTANAGVLDTNETWQYTCTVSNVTDDFTNTVNVTADDPDGGDVTDEDDEPITVLYPDLTVSKTHTGNFTVGADGAFTITVSNQGTGAATGAITVVDTLPLDLSYISATSTNWSCDFNSGTREITCTTETDLATSSSLPSITVTVNPADNDESPYTNNVSVSTPGEEDTSDNEDDDAVTVDDAPQPDLIVDKSHTGDFTVGENGTFTFTVTNNGTGPTTGDITLTDTLPGNFSFVSGTGTDWTCGAVGQDVTCTYTGAALSSGGGSTSVDVTVNPTSAGVGIVNTAAVSTEGESDETNNDDDEPSTIIEPGEPELSIEKSHTGNFTVGQDGTFTLTVTNNGDEDTTGSIRVQDTVPDELEVQSRGGTDWDCSASTGQIVDCTHPGPATSGGGTLPDLTITVRPTTSGDYTNSATVSGGGDDTPDDDNDDVTVNPPNEPVLNIVKNHDSGFVVGEEGVFTLTVSNTGSADLDGPVSVEDVVPDNLVVQSVDGGTDWDCSASSGQSVSCDYTGSDLPLSQDEALPDIEITVIPSSTGSYTNTASATADEGEEEDEDSDEVTVTDDPQPDLTMDKEHEGSFTVGEDEEYTLTVSNIGSAAATETITVTDDLPDSFDYVSASGDGWDCDYNDTEHRVTCTTDSDLDDGSSLPDITIVVEPTEGGSITNSAAVDTEGDENEDNDDDDDPTTVTTTGEPDLTIDKQHDGNFQVGEQETYRLIVTNDGGADFNGSLTVTDTLPDGMSFVSGSGDGWDCSASGQDVTCNYTGGDLPLEPDASLPTITLTVQIAADAAGNVTNTAVVDGDGDDNPDNDSDDDPTTIEGADVYDPPSLRKTVNADGYPELEWTMLLINPNNVPVQTRLEDYRPDGTVVIPDSVECVPGAGTTIDVCEYDAALDRVVYEGAVGPLSDVTIIFRTEVNDGVNEVDNEALVYWDEDGNGEVQDNIDANQTPMMDDAAWTQEGGEDNDGDGEPDEQPIVQGEVNIRKSVFPPFADAGDTVEWTMTITNATNGTANDISLTDSIPNTLVIESVNSTAGSANFSGQDVTFSIGSLGAGESATVTVRTQLRDDVTLPNSIVNTACVSVAGGGDVCDDATLLPTSALPATGESPMVIARNALLVLLSALGLWVFARWTMRRRTAL